MPGSRFWEPLWGSATVAVAGIAIMANAIITARSNLACVRIHVATRGPIVASRVTGRAAPVWLHVGAVLAVVSVDTDLRRDPHDRRHEERDCDQCSHFVLGSS